MVRGILIFLSCTILALVYIFQHVNVLAYITWVAGFEPDYFHTYLPFIVNKTLRLIFNDIACMLLILAIFQERKYLTMAFYVFLFELVFLLPLYFWLKLATEGPVEISSPLLSQVHRMIVNPTLMIVLIGSFFYQRFKTKGSGRYV